MKGWIELVAGTLGGGKSLYSVERAYYHLRSGGHVYTNVEMYHDEVRKKMVEEGYEFVPERLVILDGNTISGFANQIPRGTAASLVLVMIDEAHLEWNSRDYQTTKGDPQAKEMLNFITLVRKLDICLLFITQSPEDIDKQMRKKANWLVMCRNFKQVHVLGMFALPLPVFARTRFDISVGSNKPRKAESEWFLRPKWVCRLYNSDALLGAAAGKYSQMRVVVAEPLRRIPRPPEFAFAADQKLAVFASVCAGLFF